MCLSSFLPPDALIGKLVSGGKKSGVSPHLCTAYSSSGQAGGNSEKDQNEGVVFPSVQMWSTQGMRKRWRESMNNLLASEIKPGLPSLSIQLCGEIAAQK